MFSFIFSLPERGLSESPFRERGKIPPEKVPFFVRTPKKKQKIRLAPFPLS
jgi:hypothetical protein